MVYHYGKWAGNPKGQPEDPKRCAAQVLPTSTPISHQCSRKRRHGLYCTQHAKMVAAGIRVLPLNMPRW